MFAIGTVYILLGGVWLCLYKAEKINKLIMYNSIAFICTGIINLVLFIAKIFIGYNLIMLLISTLSVIFCSLYCFCNLNKINQINYSKQVMDILTNND